MHHVVSNNLRNNQVSYAIDNELEFGYNCILYHYHIKDPQAVLIFDLRKSKSMCNILLWPNMPLV